MIFLSWNKNKKYWSNKSCWNDRRNRHTLKNWKEMQMQTAALLSTMTQIFSRPLHNLYFHLEKMCELTIFTYLWKNCTFRVIFYYKLSLSMREKCILKTNKRHFWCDFNFYNAFHSLFHDKWPTWSTSTQNLNQPEPQIGAYGWVEPQTNPELYPPLGSR